MVELGEMNRIWVAERSPINRSSRHGLNDAGGSANSLASGLRTDFTTDLSLSLRSRLTTIGENDVQNHGRAKFAQTDPALYIQIDTLLYIRCVWDVHIDFGLGCGATLRLMSPRASEEG